MKKLLALVVLASSTLLVAQAQTTAPPSTTWSKICSETCTITSAPAGTTYRFGVTQTVTQNNCGNLGWLAPVTLTTAITSATPLTVYYTSFSCDPAPNVIKEFDVQQTNAPQTILWKDSNNNAQTTVVPALPLPTVTIPLSAWTPGAIVPGGGMSSQCQYGLATSKNPDGSPGYELFYVVCVSPPASGQSLTN